MFCSNFKMNGNYGTFASSNAPYSSYNHNAIIFSDTVYAVSVLFIGVIKVIGLYGLIMEKVIGRQLKTAKDC